MTKNIAIYTDTGAGPESITQWKIHFDRLHILYTEILATDILQGALSAYDIFIVTGGADVLYCEKLRGQGVQYIRDFVIHGGHYIGSCAGAYFAHSHIAWHNTTESIVGKRELALFNGTAKGPLHKPYVPTTEQGTIGVSMTLTPDPENIGTATVYLNGGPIMAVDTHTTILGEFSHKRHTYPAIIQKRIGTGKATALSPHIEYSEDFLQNKIPPCRNRQKMWDYILKHIILR